MRLKKQELSFWMVGIAFSMLLTACASGSIDYVAPSSIKEYSPKINSYHNPLRFAQVGDGDFSKKKLNVAFVKSDALRKVPFSKIVLQREATLENGFDVKIIYHFGKVHAFNLKDSATAVSLYSNKTLFRVSSSGKGWMENVFETINQVNKEVKMELAPGKPLYRVVIAEKLAYQKKSSP